MYPCGSTSRRLSVPSRYWLGPGRTASDGRTPGPQGACTSPMYSNPVHAPLRAGTWRCCDGRESTGARGTRRQRDCRSGRAPGGVGTGAGARLRVGLVHMYVRRCGRAPGGVAMGAGARVPVGNIGLCVRVHSLNNAPYLAWNLHLGAFLGACLRLNRPKSIKTAQKRRTSHRRALGTSGTTVVCTWLGTLFKEPTRTPLMAGTWRCCGGRGHTAARGTTRSV